MAESIFSDASDVSSGTTYRRGDQFGPYAIESLLGRGGMGSVFKASHNMLGREVALKVLLPRYVNDQKFRAQFIEEAKAMASMDHRNLLPVIDFGIDRDHLWMATKLMMGDMANLVKDQGRLKPHSAVSVMRNVACGLEAVHDQGLIHRDIKPSNVFYGKDEVRLADFGLVSDPTSGSAYNPIGTPAYTPPEVVQGNAVDMRTDIYGLGATLFYLTTGMHPFDGSNHQVILRKVVNAPTPDPREYRADLHPEVAETIMRLMAKNPGDRPRSATEARGRLATLADILRSSTEQDQDTRNRSETNASHTEESPAPSSEPTRKETKTGILTRMFRSHHTDATTAESVNAVGDASHQGEPEQPDEDVAPERIHPDTGEIAPPGTKWKATVYRGQKTYMTVTSH